MRLDVCGARGRASPQATAPQRCHKLRGPIYPKGDLARQHGLSVGPGLAELLTHQVELDDAIQAKPIVAGANGQGGGERSLDVIAAGASPPNPAELLESQAMSGVLAKLGQRYDLVVIDTAPLGAGEGERG